MNLTKNILANQDATLIERFNMTVQSILGLLIIVSSFGVILARKPVHSCLSFLFTLISLSALYLQLEAPFIAGMQLLVYAGAILVIFMFVIILFQDAYQAIKQYPAKSTPLWQTVAALLFVAVSVAIGKQIAPLLPVPEKLPAGYGSVEALGRALYIDFFFPFEAVGLLFLVAIVGALYIGKKV